MPVKVFGSPTSPEVARAMTCLFEKEIEFQLICVDSFRSTKRLPQPPHGEAVAFEDGDVTLVESRKILRHIAEKYKDQGNRDLFGPGALERASIEQWLETGEKCFDVPSADMLYSLAYLQLDGRGAGAPAAAVVAPAEAGGDAAAVGEEPQGGGQAAGHLRSALRRDGVPGLRQLHDRRPLPPAQRRQHRRGPAPHRVAQEREEVVGHHLPPGFMEQGQGAAAVHGDGGAVLISNPGLQANRISMHDSIVLNF
ncbi:hypothetical protein U9M48_007899 [Paspalum notatum var. saurae]|uniref:glutathione transferase n=1 Tax=Paspalum notatum var. saurae TaxID=547442 RepID=A0AAQ3WC90_PASNO